MTEPSDILAQAAAEARAGALARAEGSFREAMKRAPGNVPAKAGLARVLKDRGQLLGAQALADEILALDPDHADAQLTRAAADQYLGDIDGAIAGFRRVIALAPNRGEAFRHLAGLVGGGELDDLMAAMTSLAEDEDATPDDRLQAGFALGKVLEDRSEYGPAFRHLATANRLKRGSLAFDPNLVPNNVERLIEAFPSGPGFLASSGVVLEIEDDRPTPVFIVGMPRSGSTLIEQILSRHPRVLAGGETPHFELAMSAVVRARGIRFPEDAAGFAPDDLRQIREAYYERALSDTETATGKSHVTDKMLGNFMFIGLIRRALPDARIIHAARDPLDSCFSMFARLFAFTHHYTYDQTELGRTYAAYLKLMRHWQTAVAQPFETVRYETLVENPEPETRRLLTHAGLDFDAACLDPDKAERAVQTSSVAQVRQPVHTRSVGRARPFRSWLGPLEEALKS